MHNLVLLKFCFTTDVGSRTCNLQLLSLMSGLVSLQEARRKGRSKKKSKHTSPVRKSERVRKPVKASLAEEESDDDEPDPDDETGDEEDEEAASGEDDEEGQYKEVPWDNLMVVIMLETVWTGSQQYS